MGTLPDVPDDQYRQWQAEQPTPAPSQTPYRFPIDPTTGQLAPQPTPTPAPEPEPEPEPEPTPAPPPPTPEPTTPPSQPMNWPSQVFSNALSAAQGAGADIQKFAADFSARLDQGVNTVNDAFAAGLTAA